MFAKRPDRVISLAVQGMLPKNKLGKAMAKKLKGLRRCRTSAHRPTPASPHTHPATQNQQIKLNKAELMKRTI